MRDVNTDAQDASDDVADAQGAYDGDDYFPDVMSDDDGDGDEDPEPDAGDGYDAEDDC